MSDVHTPPAPNEALDRLYRAHRGSVYRYALTLVGNHADAEDLTQTTFLNAYRALTHGQSPRLPKPGSAKLPAMRSASMYAMGHAGRVRCRSTTTCSPLRGSIAFCS